MRASRKGFAVAISRQDGSTFLACSSPGVLPAVFVQRKWAVKHRRELKLHGFKCRVVPVTFTEPMEARSKTRGTADAVG